jgi:hypothetical protein
MANVAYTSRVKVERVDGKVRQAYLPAEPEPVLLTVGWSWATRVPPLRPILRPHPRARSAP